MEKVWKVTGKKPAQLEAIPKIPSTCVYLWEWYLEIGSYGEQTFTELKAWSDLTGIRLTPFELSVLRKLDASFTKVHNGNNRPSGN